MKEAYNNSVGLFCHAVLKVTWVEVIVIYFISMFVLEGVDPYARTVFNYDIRSFVLPVIALIPFVFRLCQFQYFNDEEFNVKLVFFVAMAFVLLHFWDVEYFRGFITADGFVRHDYYLNYILSSEQTLEWAVFVAFLLVVIVPLFEEIFYRVWLYQKLGQFVGSWVSILISATIFASQHYDFYLSFIFALTMHLIYIKTQSFRNVLFIHCLYNGLNTLFYHVWVPYCLHHDYSIATREHLGTTSWVLIFTPALCLLSFMYLFRKK
ncbi:CPBP family intramembrane glutamic endopeptidase [Photobacterium sp. 1_MG-2023]|uniref:CPBP family intramembrane glutamic endopeptidase n=1 Tax=Photobacterium sp. 1_MG-2023 TaxID=3062646 RepID=UPI0026E47FC2|nr:type II CAAX endopeptidase family protein [Photobacterium sp. 1_MG-2023]MDO6706358.1 type II CAAX endopeptidase family protein [Photobacterium sp. 1_MG-2023]